AELRNLIKQYDEMLNKNWGLATKEQKARIKKLKADATVAKNTADKLTADNKSFELLEALNNVMSGGDGSEQGGDNQ
ncbi:hypothetical protein NHH15_09165, partial [Lachnospiraceae bacterium PAL113]|nr:hypothetical protein [Aequitasia blattaphilus]MCR8615222.1 hypothetical protein [Aequitasia blattaphilus]